jgi:hypothetical protein
LTYDASNVMTRYVRVRNWLLFLFLNVSLTWSCF